MDAATVESTDTQAVSESSSQSRFDVQRLYVKEQSCKIPQGAAIFQVEWKPNIQIEMNIKHEVLSPITYEVTLYLTLNAKNHERTAFLLEVQQAGIFVIENINEVQRNLLLQVHCPTILYPYARKVVSDAVQAAGFPALALAPINFEGLYAQQQAQDTPLNKNTKEARMAPVTFQPVASH